MNGSHDLYCAEEADGCGSFARTKPEGGPDQEGSEEKCPGVTLHLGVKSRAEDNACCEKHGDKQADRF